MNPLTTTLVLARQTTVRLLRSRISWLFALGAVVAALLLYGVSRRPARELAGDTMFGLLVSTAYLGFALPFASVYFGVQAVQSDIEDRTSVYLFSRPLSRTAMLFGKWLASALVAAALLCFAIALLYVTLNWRAWRGNVRPPAAMLASFVQVTAVAAMAYAGLGAWFGAYFRRPLIAGVIFLVGWEGAVANLSQHATARSFTVADSIRRFLWEAHAPRDQYRAVVLGPAQILPDPDALDPTWAMLRFAAIAVVLGALVYVRREYDARTTE